MAESWQIYQAGVRNIVTCDKRSYGENVKWQQTKVWCKLERQKELIKELNAINEVATYHILMFLLQGILNVMFLLHSVDLELAWCGKKREQARLQ
jgi:hypothetical protein